MSKTEELEDLLDAKGKAAITILIHEIFECQNIGQIHNLLDCWVQANGLHPEEVVTVSDYQALRKYLSGVEKWH